MKTININSVPNHDDGTQNINSMHNNKTISNDDVTMASSKNFDEAEATKVDFEKTQISNYSSKDSSINQSDNLSFEQSESGKSENRPPSSKTDDLESLNSKKSEKGVSKEILVAGVAGVAISGIAAGIAYSEEINEALNTNSTKKEIADVLSPQQKDKLNTEVQEKNSAIGNSEKQADPQPTNDQKIDLEDQEGSAVDPQGEKNYGTETITKINEIEPPSKPKQIEDLNPGVENPDRFPLIPPTIEEVELPETKGPYVNKEIQNSIDIEITNDSGCYEVRLTDTNSDGILDLLDADAQLIDGTHLKIVATGDSIGQLLQGDIRIAEPEEYPMNQFDVYQIQFGDTLSEIADRNNTSIARLMELNPEITDADHIMSGNNLIIPLNDNESNPYNGYQFTPKEETVSGIDVGTFDSTVNEQIAREPVYFVTDSSSSSELFDASGLDVIGDTYSTIAENLEYKSTLDSMDFSEFDPGDSFYSFDNEILF